MLLLRKLLFPFSLVYAVVVYLRNILYDKGILKGQSAAVPTLCIGNLSVGGTGKTPMTEWVVDRLKEEKKTAILSRGYKRSSTGFVLAHGQRTVNELGDEPYQMYRKFGGKVSLAVDADRRAGVRKLMEKVAPEVVVLDDAYQHRSLVPTQSILLTSYERPYHRDWYLPTGNLRDHKCAAQRANVIVVTKCPVDLSPSHARSIVKGIRPVPGQRLLFACLDYGTHFLGEQGTQAFDGLRVQQVAVVTGIAQPEPFLNHLKAKGLQFRHFKYPDHHFFTPKEIDMLAKQAIVLTTEKDYVRLKAHLEDVYYLPVAHKFLFDGEHELLSALKEKGIM